MLLCMAGLSARADKQVTIDLSANYGTDTNVALSTEDFDDLTITFEAGEGNTPIWNYNHFRLNTGNTMTVKAKNGMKVVSILFNYAAQKKLVDPTVEPEGYTYDADTRTIKGENSDVVKVTNTGAQSRINTMVITLNEGGAAAADPEEFKYSTNTDQDDDCGTIETDDGLKIEGENVTISWHQFENPNAKPIFNLNHIRFYANSKMVISSEKYNIAKVEFKYVMKRDPKSANATYTITPDNYTYDYDTNVLEGSGAKTVEVVTSAQTRINYIKVYFDNGGSETADIDIHDNYAMMPTVKVNTWDELPEQKHPNYIYYISSESAIGQEPTDVNVVLVGGSASISYAITVNDGYPFENVMAYHCAAWYEHQYTERMNPVYLPYDVPMPDQESNDLKVYTFEGVQSGAFCFTQVEEMKAYEPYLIVAAAEADSVTVFDGGFGVRNMPVSPKQAGTVAMGDYTFSGTNLGLSAEEVAKATYYVVKGEQWVKTTEAIAPLTSYVMTTAADAPDHFDIMLDGVLTAIDSVSAETPQRQGTYSLDGRRIADGQLRHGIYVVDGKKVVR